jgi:hypothetical protein
MYHRDFLVNISDMTKFHQCDYMAQCLLQLTASQLFSQKTSSLYTKSWHSTLYCAYWIQLTPLYVFFQAHFNIIP